MSQTIAQKVRDNVLYPSVQKIDFKDFENALCPFKVPLPTSLKHKVEDFIEFFSPYYLEAREHNFSVLNCVDFHFSDSKLKIIEMNTNASGYFLSHFLEAEDQVKSYENEILVAFQDSFQNQLDAIYINDVDPEKEKMFVEFLMTKDFFERNNIKTKVLKTEELVQQLKTSQEVIYAYNRDCDFYLDENLDMKRDWQDKRLILSAHPEAYQKIASKKNLVEMSDLSPLFLKSYELTEENKESLWEKRKSFFFKPLESFGSKGVYAGKSVSKKKFQEIVSLGGYCAQELHPPGRIEFDGEEWKFDIRVYFSAKKIHKYLARVYKGQVTNFKEPGGGFALIDWIHY